MDWFSRYVLAWEVSISLESAFCVAAVDWALTTRRPEIFNTDQGAQFTSEVFSRFYFKAMCSAISSANTSSLVWIFFSRNSIRCCSAW